MKWLGRGREFQVLVKRLGKKLESRTETACGLASFLLLPLVELAVGLDKEKKSLVLKHVWLCKIL